MMKRETNEVLNYRGGANQYQATTEIFRRI